MGQLTDALTKAKQELEVAFIQRNEYEKELKEVRSDKRLTLVEREQRANAVKSFIKSYEADIQTCIINIKKIEKDINDYLEKLSKAIYTETAEVNEELQDLLKLNVELNTRVNNLSDRILQSRRNVDVIRFSKNLFEGDLKKHWDFVERTLESTVDEVTKLNRKAATVKIKSNLR